MILTQEKALALAEKYGTPLYVYDESIIRARCRELAGLLPGRNFKVNYSAKANTNLEILKIVREEGLLVDAMSPGEIYIEELAGYQPDEIFYIGNNVSAEEMGFAVERGILVSVDSLSQLETFGKHFPNERVAIRFNSGVGVGHHEKVVTGGKKTKFAVQKDFVPQVKALLEKYDLTLAGINQHIGSFFLQPDEYADGARALLEIVKQFPGLSFVDFGGGFGIPYETVHRLDLKALAEMFDGILGDFLAEYDNKDIMFKIEPGRYIVAESSVILGRVHSIKDNYGRRYIGTDIGFNVNMRPVMYDAYHNIDVAKKQDTSDTEEVYVCGNICETGDLLAKERRIKKAELGDVIVMEDAGAYGFAMASNYNCRLKPAEVLIEESGNDRLIRRRETLEDLTRQFV